MGDGPRAPITRSVPEDIRARALIAAEDFAPNPKELVRRIGAPDTVEGWQALADSLSLAPPPEYICVSVWTTPTIAEFADTMIFGQIVPSAGSAIAAPPFWLTATAFSVGAVTHQTSSMPLALSAAEF